MPGDRICCRSVRLMLSSFSFSSAISTLRWFAMVPPVTAPINASASVIPTTSIPNGVTHSVLPSSTCCRAFFSRT